MHFVAAHRNPNELFNQDAAKHIHYGCEWNFVSILALLKNKISSVTKMSGVQWRKFKLCPLKLVAAK